MSVYPASCPIVLLFLLMRSSFNACILYIRYETLSASLSHGLSINSHPPEIKPGRFDLCSLLCTNTHIWPTTHRMHIIKKKKKKSHSSTLSVLLHSWLRGWDNKKREIERDGGGAKSSIIYGWNVIRGRSLDGQRAYWQIDPICFATSHHHYPAKKKPKLKYENGSIVYCVCVARDLKCICHGCMVYSIIIFIFFLGLILIRLL